MYGLGKKRTPLGNFLDRKKVSQGDLAEATGRSRNTISDLCDGNKNIRANAETKIVITGALRRMGHDVTIEDLWP